MHWTQPHVWDELRRFALKLQESSGATPESDKDICIPASTTLVTLSNAKVGADIDIFLTN